MSRSGLADTGQAFISYSSIDRERVLPIVAAMREAGIVCWIDQHGIEGGANWGLRIAEAVEHCTAFVLMSSEASLASRNVRQEIALAWKYNRPYLPLARMYLDEALASFEELENLPGIAAAVYGLSRIDLFAGDLVAARETTARALTLFRDTGDRSGICSAACDLATVLLDSGEADGASVLLREALTIAREDGRHTSEALALTALGFAAWEQNHRAQAADRWREALHVNADVRDMRQFAECFEGLAMVAATAGDAERAACLTGAADAIRERLPLLRVGRKC